MTERFDSKVVAPDYMRIAVKSWGDVIDSGRNNLRSLIAIHQGNINGNQGAIKRLDGYTGVLQGKSGADFTKAAKRYDNPQFGSRDLTLQRDGVEPVKKEDKERKEGSTTFNKCGWCKYRGGGSYRYTYMISGSCELLSNADMEINHERGVNTNCSFPSMSATEISRTVDRYKQKQQWLKEDIAKEDNLTAFMEGLAMEAEEKPHFPQLRPYNLFNIGDEVIFYVNRKVKNLVGKPRFVEGKVVNGYRHHDGYVGFVADETWHTGDNEEGRGGGSGIGRADTLPKKEFDYLIHHPDFLELWLNQIEDHEVGEYDEFKRAIRALARPHSSKES